MLWGKGNDRKLKGSGTIRSLLLDRQKERSGANGQDIRASMTAIRQPLVHAQWSSGCAEKTARLNKEEERRKESVPGYVCSG